MIIQINLLNGLALGFTVIDWGEPDEDEQNQYRFTTNIFFLFLAITFYHLYPNDEG